MAGVVNSFMTQVAEAAKECPKAKFTIAYPLL
jgi:hypothetical protein